MERLAKLSAVLASVILLFAACGRKQPEALFKPSLSALGVQTFTINGANDEIIRGKGGSIFAIPAGAFQDAYGNAVNGAVEIRLIEARTLNDMIKLGLQTLSDKGILQTDGSYSIEAWKDGSLLRINPETGIFAYFPTNQKDPDMKLWGGTAYDQSVAWTLVADKEYAIPDCDASKEAKKRCLKCEKLVKMSKRIKTGRKPDPDKEYWAKRYYFENGQLYYFSSGSAEALFSKKDLEECRSYLMARDKGRDLLSKVEQIQKEQTENAKAYYSYRLDRLGWYNVDKLMKEAQTNPLISFSGKVLDENGEPVKGAMVHFLSKSRKIHMMKTSEDGTYSFEFLPGESFTICAYGKNIASKDDFTLSRDSKELAPITLYPVTIEEAETFLSDFI